MSGSGNETQRRYWSGPTGTKWIERQESFNRSFRDITQAVMERAALQPGMNVLDVGCGMGSTTLAIAAAVAPGRAVGIDFSTQQIAAAKARADGRAVFIEADASEYVFAPDFDLAFSRYGVMFFTDPVKAFANIRSALKPGGRLVFICWKAFDEIPALYACYNMVRDLLPPQSPVEPNKPGPFGLSDGARTQRILAKAGYRRIAVEAISRPFFLGETLDAAVEEAMSIGPLSRAVAEVDESTKARIAERIRPIVADRRTDEGYSTLAACWLVEAFA